MEIYEEVNTVESNGLRRVTTYHCIPKLKMYSQWTIKSNFKIYLNDGITVRQILNSNVNGSIHFRC